jgi:hypothetical protein
MDERHTPQSSAPDEGELLAAYLDAETDEVTSTRIERLLRQDPEAAARLDAIARARTRLQRLDTAIPPGGFRGRLDDRLRAERAAQDTQATQAPRRSRAERHWFRPLVAVAAVLLVALIGGSALLNTVQESTGSALDTAAAPAEDGAALSDERDDAEQEAAGGGEAAESGAAAEAERAPVTSDAGAPHVDSDADIALRLQAEARSGQDAAAREAGLRAAAGLPTEPACLDGGDAAAVDLVERDGELLLVALVDGDDGRRVVVFDPDACTRLRTFAP